MPTSLTTSRDRLTLRNGPLQCGILPGIGGSIQHLSYSDPDDELRPLLRGPDPAAGPPSGPDDLGCFPLIPFSNRIAYGRFTFDGRTITLPATQATFPHALHGQGWQAPWEVVAANDHDVRLEYRHVADAWPFNYVARQRFTLFADRLCIAMTLTNTDHHVMPAGIGIHPFFPKPPGTRLTARMGGVWLNDATLLPTDLVAAPAEWDFHQGQPLDRLVMDNNFTGWDGLARIDWPDRISLVVTASSVLPYLVLYMPPGRDFFCLEPVSHMTNAVNRSDVANGVRVLAANESLAGIVTLQVHRR